MHIMRNTVCTLHINSSCPLALGKKMRIKIREILQGGNGISNTYICIAAENPGMPVVI